MNRDFKGVWIPKEIWLDSNLGWSEKLLLVEINSLDNENGCYASNEYFAKFFNLSKDRISKIIADLIKKGYIKSVLIYKKDSKEIEKRVITTTIGYSYKQLGGIVENNDRGIVENNYDNNTDINNTMNNTNNNIYMGNKFPNDTLGINTRLGGYQPTAKDNIDKYNIYIVQFEKFWNLYDKKVSKDKCLKKFMKLSESDIELIFKTLPEYIKSTPDIQYRKNPETYLNNKSWNDAIIINNPINRNQYGKNTAVNPNLTIAEVEAGLAAMEFGY